MHLKSNDKMNHKLIISNYLILGKVTLMITIL